MGKNIKFDFFMSQLTHITDIKDNEKTKISIVFYNINQTSCILRICKNRDLSEVCEALLKVRNPNTVIVYDYVYENGNTYILEENVSGKTVEEVIEEKGPLSESETAKIIIDVCKALEEFHKMQPPVVHNDINPSNIMIREDGSVKLFDFDISRTYKKGLCQNTVLFGTQEYASPEHFGYGQSEPRTDIYCLGVTMHKMLTGRGLTEDHAMTYNGRLKNIVKKCLEFDPKNRYASAQVLRVALEKSLSRGKKSFYKVICISAILLFLMTAVFCIDIFDQTNILDTNIKLENNQHLETSPKADNPPIADYDNFIDSANQEESAQMNERLSAQNVFDGGVTREDALPIDLNTELLKTIEFDGQVDWFKVPTTGNNSVYRFYVNTKVNDNPITGHTYLALYDKDGNKIKEICIDYGEEGFFDIFLASNTEYSIKVFAENTVAATGDYMLCVSERICDVGVDRENATALELDVRCTATVNSTLSDWYKFVVEETGRYVVSLHNIDVGATIDINGEKDGSSMFSGWAKNEDSCSRTFQAKKGDTMYIEITTNKPVADGTYIIEIRYE